MEIDLRKQNAVQKQIKKKTFKIHGVYDRQSLRYD